MILDVPRLREWSPDPPRDWEWLAVSDAVDVQSDGGRRIDSRDYQSSGLVPVIDQGQSFVAGFTDDESAAVSAVPLIVFGDHTRRVKLVEFPFAVGAQGVKLLSARAGWDIRFLAYALAACPLEARGYGRHWGHIKQRRIPRPSLQEQVRIRERLDEHFTRVAVAHKALASAATRCQKLRAALWWKATSPGHTAVAWRRVRLPDVTASLDSKRVPVNATERARRPGAVPYYGATGQVGWIDQHLFDEELVLLGEDGAPFLDPCAPKAYRITGPAWVNNHAHVLRPVSGTSAKYLVLVLNHFGYRGFVNGTTRLKLTKTAMESMEFDLPPLPEQRARVEAFETGASSLDAGLAEIRDSQRRLSVLGMAVIRSAFRGKLAGAAVSA